MMDVHRAQMGWAICQIRNLSWSIHNTRIQMVSKSTAQKREKYGMAQSAKNTRPSTMRRWPAVELVVIRSCRPVIREAQELIHRPFWLSLRGHTLPEPQRRRRCRRRFRRKQFWRWLTRHQPELACRVPLHCALILRVHKHSPMRVATFVARRRGALR